MENKLNDEYEAGNVVKNYRGKGIFIKSHDIPGTATEEVLFKGGTEFCTPWSIKFLEDGNEKIKDRILSLLDQREKTELSKGKFKFINEKIEAIKIEDWEELGSELEKDNKFHSYYDYVKWAKGYKKYKEDDWMGRSFKSEWDEKFFMHEDTTVYKKWDILSIEYLEGLSEYLIEQINTIYEEKGEKVIVLDAGAGYGYMATALENFISKKISKVKYEIIAVDNGEDHNDLDEKLKKLNKEETIVKYQKNITDILDGIKTEYGSKIEVQKQCLFDNISNIKPDLAYSSWPANEVDITDPLRESETLKQFILMGCPSKCGKGGYSWNDRGLETEHLEGLEKFQDINYAYGYYDDYPSKTKVFYK